jgi:hypothetical protein
MKLDKTFEGEVKKVANGDYSRNYKFALIYDLKEVSAALANRYEFDNCIKKYGREKVALCVAATIYKNAYRYETQAVNWAFDVISLWTNRSELITQEAIVNIHPAILSDNSSSLRKLTTDGDSV